MQMEENALLPKHDTDYYTGTTHFCKTCDPCGRYICHTCMADHNLWAGKKHHVVSLSVNRDKDIDWQQPDTLIQPDFLESRHSWVNQLLPDVDSLSEVFDEKEKNPSSATKCTNVSWVNQLLPDVDSLSEVFDEKEKNPSSATRCTNVSLDPKTNYYVEVKGASDEMQRPWMPLTQTSPNQYQNSDEHIYEEIKIDEEERENPMINKLDDSSELASGRKIIIVEQERENPMINERDDRSKLASESLGPKTNYYVEVKGASDEMQRPWMPLTQTSPNQYQNSDEHIYEEIKIDEQERENPMINKLDDSSELASGRKIIIVEQERDNPMINERDNRSKLASESTQQDTFLTQRQGQRNEAIYRGSDEEGIIYIKTSNPHAQDRKPVEDDSEMRTSSIDSGYNQAGVCINSCVHGDKPKTKKKSCIII